MNNQPNKAKQTNEYTRAQVGRLAAEYCLIAKAQEKEHINALESVLTDIGLMIQGIGLDLKSQARTVSRLDNAFAALRANKIEKLRKEADQLEGHYEPSDEELNKAEGSHAPAFDPEARE